MYKDPLPWPAPYPPEEQLHAELEAVVDGVQHCRHSQQLVVVCVHDEGPHGAVHGRTRTARALRSGGRDVCACLGWRKVEKGVTGFGVGGVTRTAGGDRDAHMTVSFAAVGTWWVVKIRSGPRRPRVCGPPVIMRSALRQWPASLSARLRRAGLDATVLDMPSGHATVLSVPRAAMHAHRE